MRIVGYSCRLPGAPNVDAFWSLLSEGRCAVRAIPADRFPPGRFRHPDRSARGRSVSFAAGVIDDAFAFDAAFFGVSPREATQMDPQQRVLLEVVWEALESAQIPPSSLAGSDVGVFVGASSSDYLYRFVLDRAAMDAQTMTGNTLSILANRISYQLDLRGPSLSIDTACSSSLVALAQACDAIAGGRIDTAIVAGVSILTAPHAFLGFSAAHMLSPTGLCRAFDADGDGYVRAEGAVALVLQAQGTARRAHRAGLGDIVGWGANADGRTHGLSLPSSASQADLLRRVYRQFGIDPQALAFVEAHGTGTRVGDPAEAGAIGAVLGRARARRLPIGSVKTNVGHLEPASGLVGTLKAALALRHGLLPASLHFRTPNPDIPFEDLNLEVAAEAMEIGPDHGRLAGVSSFGFGGANAHVVLRAADRAAQAVRPRPRRAPLIVTAQSQSALRALAGAYRDALGRSDAGDLPAFANAAAYTRDPLSHRAIVVARSPATALDALDALAEGRANADVVDGRAPAAGGATLFAFSGNGSQWPGMGRDALRGDAAFRRAIERVDDLFAPRAGWSLKDALKAEDIESRLQRAEYAQPLLFAVQVGIVEALAAQGLAPDMTMGHSVGEVAAAWAAGMLSLADAVRIVHARSRCQEAARGLGGMAAVNVAPQEIVDVVGAGACAGVEIAAFNAPRSLTVSGPAEALDAFLKIARKRRWPFRRLAIDYPYHSALLEPMRADLVARLEGVSPQDGPIPFLSTVTGAPEKGGELGAAYWWRNLREPVRFAGALAAGLSLKAATAIEIGPNPVLSSYMEATAREEGKPLAVLASLTRAGTLGAKGADAPFARIAAHALAHGARIDRARFFGRPARAQVPLPHYAWDRAEYRVERTRSAYGEFAPAPHPLLGDPPRDDSPVYFNDFDTSLFPFLEDHKAGGAVVVPAAVILEMALAAAARALGAPAAELRDCAIHRPFVLEPGVTRETMARVSHEERTIDLFSRSRAGDDEWLHHARAGFAQAQPAPIAPAPLPAGARRVLSREEVYERARAVRLDYGPAFQTVVQAELLDGGVRARIATRGGAPAGCLSDPTAIDGGLQAALCALTEGRDDGRAFLPTRFERFQLLRPGGAVASVDIFIRRAWADSALVDCVFRAANGDVVAIIEGGRSMAAWLGAVERGAETYRTSAVRLDGARAERPACSLSPAAERAAPDPLEETALAAIACGLRRAMGADAFDPAFPDAAAPSRQAKPESIAPLLERLEAAGLAERRKSTWKLFPSAGFAGSLRALVERRPDFVLEATFLAAIEDALPRLLAGEPASSRLAGLADRIATGGGDLARALARIAGEFRAQAEPVRALLAGAGDAARLRALARAIPPARGSLCVVDADPGRLAAVSADLDDIANLEILPADRIGMRVFDLALAAPGAGEAAALARRLRGCLAAGGQVVFVAPAAGALAGLVALARPRADGASDWAMALVEAGFVDVARGFTHEGGAALEVVTAVQPAATDADEAPPEVAFRVAGGEARLADALIGALRAQGARAEAGIVEASPDVAAAEQSPVVVLLDCARPAGDDPSGWIAARCLEIRSALLSLAGGRGRLVVLAPGAMRLAAGAPGGRPEAHAILGFLRVAANEFPACDVRLVDADLDGLDAAGWRALASELVAPGPERELLLLGGARFGLRIVREPAGARIGADEAATVRLEAPAKGSLERVVWARGERRAPGPDEIEIEVRAAGLNFRDVMWSLGALPPEALEDGFAGPTLGLECAGVVARAGANVTHLKPGQSCIAFAPNALAAHAVTPARAAAPTPAGLSHEAAATIPVCFVTVFYSLVTLAALQPGETVLVHGGAGGVGLAALQIAKWRGARVIATAGQEEKRALLRALGADHVFDSRSLAFVDQTMAATGGAGVDVVLNSLAGEAMERSIRCLKPFGRFVELGKADFFANTRIGLRPFSRNLSYFGVDADQLFTGRPDLARTIFAEIAKLFAEGRLRPLPHAVFEGEDVVGALRQMQRSAHVGKLVVRPPRGRAQETRRALMRLRPDGAYVVVGGLGGFGLALAERLVARGAGAVVLAGRRPPGPRAQAVVERLRAGGARVEARTVDAGNVDAVRALVADYADGAGVRGLYHCAMTLDDRLIENLSAESLAPVLASKIAVARALDAVSRGLDLDHFVLFSSATTLVGNPGQANYVAANAFLEDMARARRAAGLPALAVGWGPIADVGYLAQEDAGAQLAARKLARHALSAEAALDGLERILACDDGAVESAAIGFGRFDFAALGRELPLAASSLFAAIRTAGGDAAAQDAPASDLAAELAGMPAVEARARIVAILTGEIARILRTQPAQVDPLKPLGELGVDSLMGVELRLAAEERLGVDMPLMSIGGAGSITDLADRALRRMRGAPDETQGGDERSRKVGK